MTISAATSAAPRSLPDYTDPCSTLDLIANALFTASEHKCHFSCFKMLLSPIRRREGFFRFIARPPQFSTMVHSCLFNAHWINACRLEPLWYSPTKENRKLTLFLFGTGACRPRCHLEHTKVQTDCLNGIISEQVLRSFDHETATLP